MSQGRDPGGGSDVSMRAEITAFLGSWPGPKMSTIDLICLISVALSKRIHLAPLGSSVASRKEMLMP